MNWLRIVIFVTAILTLSVGVGLTFGTGYGMIAGGIVVIVDLWMASLKQQGKHVEHSRATRRAKG